MSLLHVFCVTILFATLLETYGQAPCVPGPVINLSISLSRGLTWSRPSGGCDVDSYLVTIRGDKDPNFLYYVQSPRLNVSFLPICESFQFSVRAIGSDHIQGLETILSAKTPPLGLNLTVDQITADQNGQSLNLSWVMNRGVEDCVDYFRLVVWDENSTVPNDVYVRGTSLVMDIVPCMRYEFEIRALIGAQEEGDATYANYTSRAAPTSPPTLARIVQGVTTINITWNLPSYSTNRCPILELIADASPNFNTSFALLDSPDRPPFTMTLRGLTPNTIYLCRIYVVNRGGISSPLAMALQTQPAAAAIDMDEISHTIHNQQYPQHSNKLKSPNVIVRNKKITS